MTAAGLSRIHQISMRAHDIERAVRFYRDALRLPFLFTAPPRLAFFNCDGVRLMLSTPEPGFDHPGSVLYFAVEDIQQVHETLRSRGVTYRTEPHRIATLADREVWLADFEDTEASGRGGADSDSGVGAIDGEASQRFGFRERTV